MKVVDSNLINNELLASLQAAHQICVLTGAGISAESGIPTFRDAQTGLWAKYNPEELASPEGFSRNPELVWDWYAWRRDLIVETSPNPAHFALARLEKIHPQMVIITQNVDGLHQRAGSQNVIELHGNIHRFRCSEENVLVTEIQDKGMKPPRCPHCQAYIRPDVVWFGESLPAAMIARAVEVTSQCDVFLSIGTSGLVYPAALLPYMALEHGAVVIEINPTHTTLSSQATYILQGKAGEILPALFKTAWPQIEYQK